MKKNLVLMGLITSLMTASSVMADGTSYSNGIQALAASILVPATSPLSASDCQVFVSELPPIIAGGLASDNNQITGPSLDADSLKKVKADLLTFYSDACNVLVDAKGTRQNLVDAMQDLGDL